MNEQWTELIFIVAAENVRKAEELAAACSQTGIYIEDYSDMEAMLPLVGAADYVDSALAQRDKSSAAIHIYLSAVESAEEAAAMISRLFEQAHIAFTLKSGSLPRTDWENDWKRQHKPHRVGEHLLLCPTWESCERSEGDILLTIDPGGAFGSGEDVTTTLCLRLLERHIKGGERVLDMGCGSGVLSVAALLLGAESALGVDIEKRVLTEAPANARLNNVGERFSVMHGNVLTDVKLSNALGGDFDLICANMVADVQLRMAMLYHAQLRAGGTLVLSGILAPRADELCSAMDSTGFTLIERLDDGEWSAFAYRK